MAQQEQGARAPPLHGIKPPSPANFDSNIAQNWKIFKQMWEDYAILSELDQRPRAFQVALFRQTLGADGLRIYNGFQFQTNEDQRTVAEIIAKFDSFAVGEVNETYERYVFNKRDQKEDETIENFLSNIRSMIKTCNYCDNCVGSILRDRIVLGVRDSDTKSTLLRKRNLTLNDAIDICKAAEGATRQSKAMQSDANQYQPINAVKKHSQSGKKESDNAGRTCKFCGQKHAFKRSLCPAYGATCTRCNGKNHFPEKCYTKINGRKPSKVNHIVEELEEDDWIGAVGGKSNKSVKCRLLVDGTPVTFMVDTGTSVNILSKKIASNYNPKTTNLRCWNMTKVTPLGNCKAEVVNPKNQRTYQVEFIVVEEDYEPLLSLQTAEKMNLINVQRENMDIVATLSEEINPTDLCTNKLGTLPGIVSFKVDENIKPQIMPERRVALAIRPKLKKELDRLVELGVITPVTKPTQWVSQICITQKKNLEMRICLDPLELNKCLIRERFTLPVLDDVLPEIRDSKLFTKVDLSSGYWHCTLDEKSSFLTTFQTCYGRYRWLRLPFGLSVSSEIFQRKLLEALNGLQNVFCIADDVIIHGKNRLDHDKSLQELLKRCREVGIVLNESKIELRKDGITFMGHRISKDGLHPDPEKVRAILDMPSPTNLDELRRFIGIVNFLSKFLPKMADTIQPLHNLLKKDVKWNWSENQQSAFETLKYNLTKAPVLAYYDPTKELTLENDASQYGLGSSLLQEGKPIAYASRALTETEQRYAQIEKEMLAIAYGLKKFRHYTYGRDVNVLTDHKPLISIVRKPLSKAPKRLQSLLLRTQEYNFCLTYKPGTTIVIADALSRSPIDDKKMNHIEHVSNLSFSPISDERLAQFRDATARDQTLSLLRQTILQGWPDHKQLISPAVLPYYSYRDELTIHDGLLLRGDRLIVPTSLRSMIKNRIHAGHLGINSCLRRARELVFWPGMSNDIRHFIEACDICTSHADKQAPEPLYMHETPNRPWERVGCDIFTIQGRNYLVTVDYCSSYFELDFLPDLYSSTVITKLKHQFARHGIPDILKSDSGSQFTSSDFKEFCRNWSIRHETSSPGNSKSNGKAESAVKIAKKLMMKSRAAKEDPYIGLLNYRNTPTEGMGTSPVQRLMGRRTKTLIPTILNKLQPRPFYDEMEKHKLDVKRSNIAERQLNNRELQPLDLGDTVRMQPIKTGEKLWKEAEVTKILKDRSYEVTTADNGKTLRRNRQFLRLHPTKSPNKNDSDINKEPPNLAEHEEDPKDDAKNLIPYKTRSGRISKPPERFEAS